MPSHRERLDTTAASDIITSPTISNLTFKSPPSRPASAETHHSYISDRCLLGDIEVLEGMDKGVHENKVGMAPQ
jgi:hypothetical protein